MKIGIVSIFDNMNLGNRLQNYALHYVLKQYADEVITIKNKSFLRGKARLVRMIPLAENAAIARMLGMKKRAKLLSFTNKNIPLSRKCYWYDRPLYSLKKEDCCNLYCAGSDQVWSPDCGRTGAFNYLEFAELNRTFSYAASFGVDKIPNECVEDVRKGLQHIKFISVREDAGKRIVEELTGRTDVQVLIDPTMLLSTDEWDQVIEKPEQGVPSKYLLSYFLGDMSNELRLAIQNEAERLGCEVIDLMDKNAPYFATSPSEFVYLIKYAYVVYTDSFHGSVFSFLYQRPLAIFKRRGSGSNLRSRLETFVDTFGLQSCMMDENGIQRMSLEMDYSAGLVALESERKKAKSFLGKVLQEAQSIDL